MAKAINTLKRVPFLIEPRTLYVVSTPIGIIYDEYDDVHTRMTS